MKRPRLEIKIDGRKEKLIAGNYQQIRYHIQNLEEESTRRKLRSSIGSIVREIKAVSGSKEAVDVIFDANLVSASFIDYRLRAGGVKFTRGGKKGG